MGMLTGNCGGQTEIQKDYQRCKPDYEAQIKAAKDSITKAVNLKQAIFDFIGDYSSSDKLNEMIGELVFIERRLNARIEQIIREQEADQD